MLRLLAVATFVLVSGATPSLADGEALIEDAMSKRSICRGTNPGPAENKACGEATEAEFRLAASGYCFDFGISTWRKGKAKEHSISCVRQ